MTKSPSTKKPHKGARYIARERALQLLFQMEYHDDPYEQQEETFLKSNAIQRKGFSTFTSELAKKTYADKSDFDTKISGALKGWKIERIPMTDRICLRMALCEMRDFADIPIKVTLNEYINLARAYGTDDSFKYVNAVLDRFARDFPQKDFIIDKKKDGSTDSEPEA